MEEVLHISDHVVVLHEGVLSLERSEYVEENIMRLAVGKRAATLIGAIT
jgi:ABC-type sugar transport system ATPase subunit